MKIVCQKQDLMKGISIALRAVPTRTTMPILDCILINARTDKIHLLSNDMELGVDTLVEGKILEGGIVAINAKMLSDIVRKLPDNDVVINCDEGLIVEITCEKARFAIGGQPGDEFPYLPEVERDEKIEISQFTMKEIIAQTIFSISSNDKNPLMTGELLEIRGDNMRVISLDGHRISIRCVELKENYPDYNVIVPGKALSEVSKILSGEMKDMLGLYITASHIIFEMPGTMVISRLIEGRYFAVDQMISSDYATKVKVERALLLSCIDRATLFVNENDKKPIVLDFSPDTLKLSIDSPMGSMQEEIDIRKEGPDLTIGFNPRFLIDALKAIDEEEVTLYMTNAKSPCFIRDDARSYIYLILPINFTR